MKKSSMPKGSNKGNYATLIETTEDVLNLNTGDTLLFNLAEYQRAQEVAHAYKYYRLAKVEIDWIPYANVSSLGGAAAQRLPQLYKTVDRVANMNIAPSEDEMLERGIKPTLFKSINTVKFKPNLLQIVQLEVNQPADGAGVPLGVNAISAVNSIPLFDKWLPTQQSIGYPPVPGYAQNGRTLTQPAVNPYALNYYGMSYIVAQEGGTPGVACGDIQLRLTWEFKGARALKTVLPIPFVVTAAEEATSTNTVGVIANTQPTEYP